MDLLHRPVGCSGTEYVQVPRILLPMERMLNNCLLHC